MHLKGVTTAKVVTARLTFRLITGSHDHGCKEEDNAGRSNTYAWIAPLFRSVYTILQDVGNAAIECSPWWTQDTFDEAVKENIQEFDMEVRMACSANTH